MKAIKRILVLLGFSFPLSLALALTGCSYNSVRDPSGASITRMSFFQSADLKGFKAERSTLTESSTVEFDAAKTDPNLSAVLEILKTVKPVNP